MLPEQASRTALGAARQRAAHQTLERGRIFSDPLALRILGSDAEPLNPDAENEVTRRGLRLFLAARTRFAEDALAASIPRGLRQVVILGAGLDTYAYRSPLIDGLRVFEVDHPATQTWKRQRLAEAAMFVAYLKRLDEARFKTLLLGVEDGGSFKTVFAAAYGEDIESVWQGFTAELREGTTTEHRR